RAPLQGVDDGGVLLRVLHRNLRDDDPVAGRSRHRLVTAPQVLEDLGLLGIVDDGGCGRAREHEACVRPRRDEADEKSITPTGSLSRSHLETWSTMRASAATGPSPTCAERVTRAAVPSWRVKVASPSTPCRVPLAGRIATSPGRIRRASPSELRAVASS